MVSLTVEHRIQFFFKPTTYILNGETFLETITFGDFIKNGLQFSLNVNK